MGNFCAKKDRRTDDTEDLVTARVRPQDSRYLVVALGNPGKKYTLTRHNVGHLFLEYLLIAQFNEQPWTKSTNYGQVFETKEAIYIKTHSYMNVSANIMKSVLKDYNITDVQNRLILICDDLDTKMPGVKIKGDGSARGHNGVKSFINYFKGDTNFKRVLIGVDRPKSKDPDEVGEWVLSDFTPEQLKVLKHQSFPETAKQLNLIIGQKPQE